MLVHHLLERSARRFPDKTALVFENTRLTYREIDSAANRLAQALQAGGVRRGDRVAVFLDNSDATVIAIFAILKANATFCVVNPTTKTDKLIFMLQNSRPSAVVTHTTKWAVVGPAVAEAPSVGHVVLAGATELPTFDGAARMERWDDALSGNADSAPATSAIDRDLATIIYTSGSTGNPKGVMSTHANMIAAATSITTYLENTADDIILNVLPLAFDYGLYQLIMAFLVGGTLVLERGFVFPYKVIELIRREGVTGLPGVPTIFSLLLGLKDLRAHGMPSLRYLSNTAAELPVSHILELRDAFPQAKLFSMYGLTECKRVAYLPPAQLDIRPGSVGVAIPNTEVAVVDDNDQRVAPGVIGELIVRGSHVMQGYWEAPTETAQRYRPAPAWFGLADERVLYTGDLFRTDDEGYLYFVGRKDDIIKSRGEKVAPKEVEHVLYAFEGVQDAAAIGVPDAILGEAIKVFVTPRPGFTLDERRIRDHCKRNLEDFMVPKFVEIRDELPKGGTGKINKRALAEESVSLQTNEA